MDFLKDLGLSDAEIRKLKSNLPKNIVEKLLLFPRIVVSDFNILKDIGIKNYKEIFMEHTHMFLINPDRFKAIFEKYDQKDLIRCLEKNGAVIEKL